MLDKPAATIRKEAGVSVESRAFRNALARWATGVSVVTARLGDGRPVGVTISSFSSLSLEPPLVLFCLGKTTANGEAYSGGQAFAVNVLADDQREVSEFFANPARDCFEGVSFRLGVNGCPLLIGCLVGLECTLVTTYEGGDHLIVVGRVERIASGSGKEPLLRYLGAYRRIAPLS